MTTCVAWVFSLARSGSSIAAYAAAAGFSCPVADEVLGPWNRTVPPYNYPAEQWRLVESFVRANYQLDKPTVAIARSLFDVMGGAGGGEGGQRRVVSKYPHLIEPPGMFERAFPDHGGAYLLRNPLHRLNSLYARNWIEAISSNYDMDRYKAFAKQWLVQPYGLLYDDLRLDPSGFMQRLYQGWDWPADESHVERAVEYVRSNYHADSVVLEEVGAAEKPKSEQRMMVPPDAVDAYLGDAFVVALMERVGWSTKREEYLSNNAGNAEAVAASVTMA